MLTLCGQFVFAEEHEKDPDEEEEIMNTTFTS